MDTDSELAGLVQKLCGDDDYSPDEYVNFDEETPVCQEYDDDEWNDSFFNELDASRSRGTRQRDQESSDNEDDEEEAPVPPKIKSYTEASLKTCNIISRYFSTMVLDALLHTSITFLSTSSMVSSSMLLYSQLISFNLLNACLTLLISINCCQTTLPLVGLPLMITYISGSGKPSCLERVSKVLVIGRGKKNIVPLHALSELYLGRLPVYVPKRIIV